VPELSGGAKCVRTPAQGEPCFFECADGLVCEQRTSEGRCAPPICGVLAG
jgi:hypothetical protein